MALSRRSLFGSAGGSALAIAMPPESYGGMSPAEQSAALSRLAVRAMMRGPLGKVLGRH